jgi:hypothetical protein
MRSKRVSSAQIVSDGAEQLVGAVLLAPIRIGGHALAKGTRIDPSLAGALLRAAGEGSLPAQLRLAWGDPGDLHEDEAALRLAAAVAGSGVAIGTPAQSRVDLSARVDGVLRVRVEALGQLNRIDPLEVFTLFDAQAVRARQVVASVKVAPHLVPAAIVESGEQVARSHAPLISVDPYLPLRVAAIAAEALEPGNLERFDQAARSKVTSLGGQFLGTSKISDEDPASAARQLGETLGSLAFEQHVSLILVGGVSAGDPLSPLYTALETLGGRVLRRGVPAHPGSMIWMAALGGTTLLGLPQCGMFSVATAADLILPRLLTGEQVTSDTLAELGHGGLLGKEMRFRFPAYAPGPETAG